MGKQQIRVVKQVKIQIGIVSEHWQLNSETTLKIQKNFIEHQDVHEQKPLSSKG